MNWNHLFRASLRRMADDHDWMTGQCAAWAVAHQQLNPHLKFGMHYEQLSPEDREHEVVELGLEPDEAPTHRVQHVFTHDDQRAYDADGVHPMPYHGWDDSAFNLDYPDVEGTGMLEYGYIPDARDWIQGR